MLKSCTVSLLKNIFFGKSSTVVEGKLVTMVEVSLVEEHFPSEPLKFKNKIVEW